MRNLDDLCEICTLKDVEILLDECEATIDKHRIYDSSNPFSWIKGIHWFQHSKRGRITYNKKMITIWLITKSQNNPQAHLNFVQEYQNIISKTKLKVA